MANRYDGMIVHLRRDRLATRQAPIERNASGFLRVEEASRACAAEKGGLAIMGQGRHAIFPWARVSGNVKPRANSTARRYI